MGHRIRSIAGALSAIIITALVLACDVLPNHNWKCPYTYDTVTGCGKFGMPITSKGTDTEIVTAPDKNTACLAVSEYVHLDHPGRIHVICDPSRCEDLGPIAMPGTKPQDFPSDGGFHVLDVDGGPIDPPVIVCDGGTDPNCPASNPPEGALTACVGCFIDHCCATYATQYANAVAADMNDPTMSMQFFNQLLQEAMAWLAAGTPAQGSFPAPSGTLLPPAATLGACMLTQCSGICQQPMPAGP